MVISIKMYWALMKYEKRSFDVILKKMTINLPEGKISN